MSKHQSKVYKGKSHKHLLQVVAALMCAGSLLLPSVQPAAAQEPDAAASALQVANSGGGVQIGWNGASVATASAADGGLLESLAAQLPLQRYQGYDLPFKVIPLRFAGPDAVTLPQITRLETIDLPAGMIVPGAPELPPVILEEGQEPPVAQGVVALPDQPVFVLRQGTVKGEYLVMVAISPVFSQGGVTKLATVLETNIPGANAILETPWEYGEARTAAIEAADAAQPTYEPAAEAAEADAACATVTLVVAKPGLQQIKAGDLGPNCTAASLANVRVANRGVAVPVQVVVDELRFYVESVGDRWNVNSYYQVSIESDPLKRSPAVGTRALAAPGGDAVSTVLDQGFWQDRLRWNGQSTYNSNYPGADGDHYFAALFSTNSAADKPAVLTANLRDPAKVQPPNLLPLLNSNAAYTFTVTPNALYSAGSDYEFSVSSASGPSRLVQLLWQYDPSATSFSTAVPFTDVGNPVTMTVGFVAKASPRTLYFESIAYSRLVSLAMGNRGAIFRGDAAQSVYRWSDAPQFSGGYGVWDVTDPDAPIALTGASKDGFTDDQPGRRYLVAGPEFVNTPTVRPFKPLYARSIAAAHAIYVIPAADYAAPLQPLLALRNQQGYKTATADVTRIYDAYSGGYVDSRAIRAFLKDAHSTWTNPHPISVVLVGDGTYDPKNLRTAGRPRAPLLIPPYMEENIDKWLGEAACDNCYGQFSVDANIANSAVFTMDLMVGRFPVKKVDELSAVVNKIVSYETSTDLKAAWRSTALYLADNYLKPQPCVPNQPCNPYFKDGAGDFAQHADEVRSLNPNRNNVNLTQRVYYDPFPAYQTPPAYSDWWRVPVREDAQQRALAGLRNGPALVVYNGHANVFNMGELEKAGGDRKFLLSLTNESTFYNANQLFVQLSMTCMTSSFATPANSATTIDEAYFLWPRGGAVGVWGSSGQSVVAGHESLQDGFFGKLFAKPGTPVRLGDLLDSGYLNLTLSASGNEDILRTFLLLGDPLTKVIYNPGPNATYIPVVKK